MEHLIDGEKAYPIYKLTAKWEQDGEHDPEYPIFHKGLKEGRVHNSTGFSYMFKVEQTDAELTIFSSNWWTNHYNKIDKYDKVPLSEKHVDNLVIEFKLIEYETWYLTWFQHQTFDNGQTNEEVLRSFEKFVRRKEDLNHKNSHWGGDRNFDNDKPFYTLMGAEDRWRWHGSGKNGKPDEHSPAPCRCKYCKEQGVIRIAH